MAAHSQRGGIDAVKDRQAARKGEHPERHGDGLLEQEAEGPLQEQALGETQVSCTKEEAWASEHSVDSLSGGRQAEAAEVASVVEELRKTYPKRRHISPATEAFIGTLRGVGLTKPQICRMFARDQGLFARSSEAFLEQRELLARHGVSAAGLRALLLRDTWWMSKPLRDVEGTILYVERLLGGPGKAAARLFAADPQLLSCSEADLEERVQALQREVACDIATVITKGPSLLSHYTAQNVAYEAAALREALGPELARKVLESDLAVLRLNTGVLRQQLAWLEKTFGRAAALQMVAKEPRVSGAKVETASATYAGLVGTFGEARARRMLLAQPTLLRFKWCTIEAKVDFLTKELGHTLDEVASCPLVFNYSLEGRMRPRAAALQAAGKAYRRLSSLLKPPDKKFEQRYGVRLRRSAMAASSEAEALQGRREGGLPQLYSAL